MGVQRHLEDKHNIAISKSGYDLQFVDKLSSCFENLVANNKIFGGGFLLAQHGAILAKKSFGRLTYLEDSAPFKTDTIKCAESISKIFTAMSIMILVEEGKLFLDQKVSTIISEFDNSEYKNISIYHLLTHTSGLVADPGYFDEVYPRQIFEGISDDLNWIKSLLHGPLRAQPGKEWIYCTAGFMFLAEIITRVSGSHFNDFIHTRIIEPLELKRTFMEVPETTIPEVSTIADWNYHIIRNARERSTWKMPNGGGGVYSTMEDLFKVAQCFLDKGWVGDKKILSRRSVEMMISNQLPKNTPAYLWGRKEKTHRQGIGWEFFPDKSLLPSDAFGHEGYGWVSLLIDPSNDFILVRFMATSESWTPEVMIHPREIAFAGIL